MGLMETSGSHFKWQIMNLINMHQEGAYWDFKKEWHTNKGDLLHDIICMANNLENENGYIIIGVDENNDYAPYDVSADPNRKTTQNIVDFLRGKHFAGGIRPKVFVSGLEIESTAIDVITVIDDMHTPYYLTQRYEGVCANNIYTRVMDTNTPKPSSADLYHVERLWKKRFGLLSTPLKRVLLFLNEPAKWLQCPDDSAMMEYYETAPEFTIEHVAANRDGYEYYLFGQTDSRPHWYDINIRYHQTLLASLGGVALDGGRFFTAHPQTETLHFNRRLDPTDAIQYSYFIQDTLDYAVYNYYWIRASESTEVPYINDRLMECVLVFYTKQEKEQFDKFAVEHESRYKQPSEKYLLPYFPNIDGYNMECFKKAYMNALVSQDLLHDMREQLEM